MTDPKPQLGLFDPRPKPVPPRADVYDETLGAVARDLGILRVETATPDWQERAVAAIQKLVATMPQLTTDDVWTELGREEGLEGRAMGAAMRTAVRKGLIERTERTVKSSRVACHRRDLRVWRSLVFQG